MAQQSISGDGTTELGVIHNPSIVLELSSGSGTFAVKCNGIQVLDDQTGTFRKRFNCSGNFTIVTSSSSSPVATVDVIRGIP